MTKRKDVKVAELRWQALCDLLLETEDVALLTQWMADTARTGCLYRALRVHGRMNAVRRAQEIKALKAIAMAAQKEAA